MTSCRTGGGKTAKKTKASKPGTKVCARCKQEKPLTEFNKKANYVASRCKTCLHEIYIQTTKDKVQSRYQTTKTASSSKPEPQTTVSESGPEPSRAAPATPTPPPEKMKPPVVWTKDQDKILRQNFGEIGISGIYLRNLLPRHYNMGDIKKRCQGLKLMSAFGNKYERPTHRKDERLKDEPEEDFP